MRSRGKGIYEHEVDHISYWMIGKFKYDFRFHMKDGSEIKIKRSFGKKYLKQYYKEVE